MSSRRLLALVAVLAAAGVGIAVLLSRAPEAPVDAAVATDGPGGGVAIASVSAGGYHTCAIDDDGDAWCFGLGDHGQLGTGKGDHPLTSSPVPVAMPADRTFTAVAAGNAHTCAIADDGSVWCWGVAGDGTHDADLNPPHGPERILLPASLRATSIDGLYHDCASTDDGAIWCWGRGEEGQLGNGSSEDASAPVQARAPDGVAFTQVVTGAYHTCALATDGAAWCWGQDLLGQIGDGGGPGTDVPKRVAPPGGAAFVALTAGFAHTCARTGDGAAWCWGDGSSGQLGDGGSTGASAPVAVRLPEGVSLASIDAGNAHTCAVSTDGEVWCWGLGVQGGATATGVSTTPVAVALGDGVVASAVSAGGFHTCVRSTDAEIWCFGDDAQGQLGDDASDGTSGPLRVVWSI